MHTSQATALNILESCLSAGTVGPPSIVPTNSSNAGVWVHPKLPGGFYEDIPRRREDFPKVKWWYKKDWRKHEANLSCEFGKVKQCGGTRAASGENVRYEFISDADGNPIDGFQASAIRAQFREYVLLLFKEDRAPTSWARGLDPREKVKYEAFMRATCPELQYCDNNWLCKAIGVMEYPQLWPTFAKKYPSKSSSAVSGPQLSRLKCGPGATSCAKPSIRVSSATNSAHAPKSPVTASGESTPTATSTSLDAAAYTIDSKDPDVDPSPNGTHTTPVKRASLSDGRTDDIHAQADNSSKRPRLSIMITDLPWGTETVESDSETLTNQRPAKDSGAAVAALANSISELNDSAAQTQLDVDTVYDRQTPVPVSPSPACSVPGTMSTNLKGAKIQAKKVAPRAGKGVAIWPPSTDATSLKDRCARAWAVENPSATQEEFNQWYKKAAHYKKKKYTADDPAATTPSNPEAA
ncbi:hypothetical protein BN946_scf185037.g21 [Trametes cinnabarina]|uniref:Uncharacterized protein n=1 Tax=Pycnoporus cinnabarinus TaxID=5643 RepID=A0A060SUQ6_PYCCI|nr:hypothetical protein BN946_scf185037.g21 [Trametes cinnabarina]